MQADHSSDAPIHIPQITQAVRLRLARESVGLDQAELAQAIGVSQRSIGNYERGVHPPRRPILLSWALATGVPLAWLTEGEIEGATPCPSCGHQEVPGQSDQGEPPTEQRSRCVCEKCLLGDHAGCEAKVTKAELASVYQLKIRDHS